ncbi:hypothetical protein ZWY2020_035298 [Hordeum vulgare]|nr:hypothetical protein ZWY2020_035298 [Hordeum vulgare]
MGMAAAVAAGKHGKGRTPRQRQRRRSEMGRRPRQIPGAGGRSEGDGEVAASGKQRTERRRGRRRQPRHGPAAAAARKHGTSPVFIPREKMGSGNSVLSFEI